MQFLSKDIGQSPTTTAALEGNGLAFRMCHAIYAVMARRRTRRVVRCLSAAQLQDSGIDSEATLGGRSVIEADARLATYLASLR